MLGRQVTELSVGQQQRVAAARSLMGGSGARARRRAYIVARCAIAAQRSWSSCFVNASENARR